MAENNGNSTGTVILAFLVGGVIGAGLALLLAPASGEETRRKIRETGEDVKRKTDEFVADSRERIGELVDDGRARIGELVETGRESLNSLSTSLRNLVDEGKRAYRQRRSELSAAESNLQETTTSEDAAAT